ncbi:NAD(P)/FAD-dependent oxidoreductase [Fusibacter sp. JL216-2]|uniref:NAD(P)/FAD-dependent oxidoreductase n=1 Tax=Fusibacter sp. JL216-2 TaxID=3071453 RepID=UPI003D32A6DD
MFDLNLSSEFTSNNNNKVNSKTLYDVLVIGGGPAGLNAALYAKRKGMETAIIAERVGGQVLDTSSVENYLGTVEVSGQGLMEKFKEHVDHLKIPIKRDAKVEKVEDGQIKKIHLSGGEIIRAKSLIVATGSRPRRLGVPGEDEFSGKGVAYCAICDGPFFTDLKVAVAGGGNSAVEAAIDLSKIASEVVLVHRSDFRADQILIDRLNAIENVTVLLQTQILEVKGQSLLTHLHVLDKEANAERDIDVNGLFVEIGYLPNSKIFEGLLDMTPSGEIIVNDRTETNVPGIYAAGDVATVPYKQIIIAASEGAKAALTANDYVNKLNV